MKEHQGQDDRPNHAGWKENAGDGNAATKALLGAAEHDGDLILS
jgi:hypothetical protein